jgi:cobalt/nickel transport system permease protein
MTLVFDPLPAPDSVLRRLDPRWKLAGVLVSLPLVAVLRGLGPSLAALGATLLLAGVARFPLRWYARRMGALLLLLTPFVLVLPLLLPPAEALALGVSVAARALAVVSLALVILTSAPINESLKAAHALRMPGVLIQLFALTYRYVFLVAGELARVRIVLRARGYRNRASLESYRTIAHVTGTMLVRTHDRGERVAQAMRCRGFDGCYRSLTDFHTGPAEVLFFILMTAGFSGVLLWDLSQRGVL